MRYLLFITILLFSLSCWAQNRVFVGRVIDRQHQGIPFAVVEVKDKHQGVYCDENGFFSFSGDANFINTLVISCMGYEKKEINTDILPLNDSLIIELKTKVANLKEVAITSRKGTPKQAILGKSRRQLSYTGDCYRYYGSETAIRLKADTALHGGTLKAIYVFITDEGDYSTRFRVHVYQWDTLPQNEITDTNLIVQATEPNAWVKIEVSNKKIPVDKGLFVSVEWVAGFGNTRQALQSAKNPEVSNYNGQVLGLTSDYGKPSRTYSRSPFSKKWIYYDAPDAQRKGGYFLNPMIYCTYTYID